MDYTVQYSNKEPGGGGGGVRGYRRQCKIFFWRSERYEQSVQYFTKEVRRLMEQSRQYFRSVLHVPFSFDLTYSGSRE
jgi:hypothetical protein